MVDRCVQSTKRGIMISLVGYTGFVGSNLAESCKFDGLYNSKNIEQAFGTNPYVLFYSGVPAQKFIANKFPEEDFAIVQNALENIALLTILVFQSTNTGCISIYLSLLKFLSTMLCSF